MFGALLRMGIFFFFFAFSSLIANGSSGLLIKIHVDEPELIPGVLEKFYQKLSKQLPYHFLVSYSGDEDALKNVQAKLAAYSNLTLIPTKDLAKVESLNSGIKDKINAYDLVLVATIDIEPAVPNFDKVLVDAVSKSFPDLDGVLNNVSIGRESINFAPVIGKKYYQRFGYAYNPVYTTSGCERELTCVSRILGKEEVIATPILKFSDQPSRMRVSFADEKLFHKRRQSGFDIDDQTLRTLYPKDWSILICTLDEREKPFTHIYNKLQKQIKDNKLEDKVEIVVFRDNRENTVGFKRNSLLKKSRGLYVNFIDDDDDLHDDYVAMIYEKLKNRPDDVSLVGIITFNDENPTKFIHSVKYKSYFQADGIYYRPPNHINTIKRSIAAQFLFPTISYGEDTDWAMRIAKTGLLTKEEEISTPYYFYKYVDKK